jgi:hypothetical protein
MLEQRNNAEREKSAMKENFDEEKAHLHKEKE